MENIKVELYWFIKGHDVSTIKSFIATPRKGEVIKFDKKEFKVTEVVHMLDNDSVRCYVELVE